MRKGTGVSIAIAAVMVATLGAPASATHGGIHPTFKEQATYLHCVGANKVQNNDFPTPFDATPPSGSYQGGAGCGFLDSGALINTGPGGGQGDLGTAGTSVGNLKNLTFEVHLLGQTNYSAILNTVDLGVWLLIDGETYLAEGTQVSGIPLQASSTGASQKLEFTVTNLDDTLATEDGDGTQEREIQLTIGLWFGDENGSWVWDATEIPSGITFNDATPAGIKVPSQV